MIRLSVEHAYIRLYFAIFAPIMCKTNNFASRAQISHPNLRDLMIFASMALRSPRALWLATLLLTLVIAAERCSAQHPHRSAFGVCFAVSEYPDASPADLRAQNLFVPNVDRSSDLPESLVERRTGVVFRRLVSYTVDDEGNPIGGDKPSSRLCYLSAVEMSRLVATKLVPKKPIDKDIARIYRHIPSELSSLPFVLVDLETIQKHLLAAGFRSPYQYEWIAAADASKHPEFLNRKSGPDLTDRAPFNADWPIMDVESMPLNPNGYRGLDCNATELCVGIKRLMAYRLPSSNTTRARLRFRTVALGAATILGREQSYGEAVTFREADIHCIPIGQRGARLAFDPVLAYRRSHDCVVLGVGCPAYGAVIRHYLAAMIISTRCVTFGLLW